MVGIPVQGNEKSCREEVVCERSLQPQSRGLLDTFESTLAHQIFVVVLYCDLTTIVFGALSLEGKSHTVFAHLNVQLFDKPCRELCSGGCVDWGREEEHEGEVGVSLGCVYGVGCTWKPTRT